MNRLILIGNVFDLAHGLPTKYNDFILWYLKKVFAEAITDRIYTDKLLSITMDYNFEDSFGRYKISLDEVIDHYYTTGFKSLLSGGRLDLRPSTSFQNPFSIQITPFLETLVTNCNSMNWVDIENEYYEVLKQVLELSKPNQRKELAALNEAMETLVSELRIYFKNLEMPLISSAMVDILSSPIRPNELNPFQNDLEKEYAPQATHILSFNYTNTAELYANCNYLHLENLQLNYIHGQASKIHAPLIFGFGDELDSKYGDLELAKINDYFNFIKSFGYLKTKNLHSLLRFVSSGKYQIFILGHSCGLSDRTMLNMLFKHDNCQSIKIYYHQDAQGNNNFTELTQEISRHFKNKEMLREKVVNFEFCEHLPQVR